ncbi:MAG: Transposase IS66 [Puniceicoccaceae bacterium 5H]|nr:MAG: Transposase IS66 [Puniceicoccaceae bacterium 5H]
MPPAEALYAENQQLRAEVAQRDALIDTLQAQIAWLRQRLFGGGQGEKLETAQLQLQLEELTKLLERQAQPVAAYARRAPQSTVRQAPAEHFAHLPVEEVVTIEPDEVQAAPEAYERIGQEETFEVDLHPPRLLKRQIVRPKYRHKAERERPPVVAPAPARVVMGGYASAGLIAWVALSKYVDHLPLYRQEKMSERWGARLSRQSLCDWIDVAAQWLEPIYKTMRRGLIEGGYVQVDETPVRCHDPDAKKGQTTQGWLWVMGRPDSDVVFDWRLSRRHGELTSLLDGFAGVLQSDGYEAYARLAQTSGGTIVPVACWAHARRRFHEALAEAPLQAAFVLKLIGHLYAHERRWDAEGYTDPAQRAHLRTRDFAWTLSLLKKVALRLRQRARPKSRLGEACGYLLGQWSPLVTHCLTGQSRLDNNLIENAIRPSALGKKNWLFIGAPDAGQRSAILYSIVVSCQRHHKDPHLYLRDVLTRLPTMTNQDDLTPLTPPTGNHPPHQSCSDKIPR